MLANKTSWSIALMAGTEQLNLVHWPNSCLILTSERLKASKFWSRRIGFRSVTCLAKDADITQLVILETDLKCSSNSLIVYTIYGTKWALSSSLMTGFWLLSPMNCTPASTETSSIIMSTNAIPWRSQKRRFQSGQRFRCTKTTSSRILATRENHACRESPG